MVLCFFFQAEDGIRDKLVTGVQTCALPICTGSPMTNGSGDYAIAFSVHPHVRRTEAIRAGAAPTPSLGNDQMSPLFQAVRSEERRVGKECRSRWWPYHCKKNGTRSAGARCM